MKPRLLLLFVLFFFAQALRLSLGPPDLSAAAAPERDNKFTLSWIDTSDNEDGFTIFLKKGDGSYQEIGKAPKDATGYEVTIFAAEGTNWCFAVDAYNEGGHSAKSNDACAMVPVSIPAAATGLVAVLGAGNQVTLTWQDQAFNELGYKIYRGGVEIAKVGPNVTTFSEILTAAGGTVHTYEVAPFNAAGDGPRSNAASVTLPLPAPSAPTGLKASPLSPTQALLQWQDNSATEVAFQINRDGNGVAAVAMNETSFVDHGLKKNRRYAYTVRALGEGGISAWSNAAQVKTPNK